MEYQRHITNSYTSKKDNSRLIELRDAIRSDGERKRRFITMNSKQLIKQLKDGV
jgi:hypothetical protein